MMTEKEKMRARMFELALMYTGPMFSRYLASQKLEKPQNHDDILKVVRDIAAKIEKLIIE